MSVCLFFFFFKQKASYELRISDWSSDVCASDLSAVGEVVDVINKVIAGYGLSPDDSEQAAWSLRSALHGFCILESVEGQPAGADPDRVYRRLVELLCASSEVRGVGKECVSTCRSLWSRYN